MNTKNYYKSKDGKSLYFAAMEMGLNPYQFDFLKRIIRAEHKGQKEEDIKKSIDLLQIIKNEVFSTGQTSFILLNQLTDNWDLLEWQYKVLASFLISGNIEKTKGLLLTELNENCKLTPNTVVVDKDHYNKLEAFYNSYA